MRKRGGQKREKQDMQSENRSRNGEREGDKEIYSWINFHYL